MKYFHNDKELILEFIPKVIEENYKNELEIEDNKNKQNKIQYYPCNNKLSYKFKDIYIKQ